MVILKQFGPLFVLFCLFFFKTVVKKKKKRIWAFYQGSCISRKKMSLGWDRAEDLGARCGRGVWTGTGLGAGGCPACVCAAQRGRGTCSSMGSYWWAQRVEGKFAHWVLVAAFFGNSIPLWDSRDQSVSSPISVSKLKIFSSVKGNV